MARRPVFIAEKEQLGVKTVFIEFDWFSGMSVKQKQKSINSLHDEFHKKYNLNKVLEISTKSEIQLGVDLSAFNLKTKSLGKKIEFSVETAFQSSKIFENGGPYRDLLEKTSREAKLDPRLKNSGNLKAFNFFGKDMPTKPFTLFYDWLYINVLFKNEKLKNEILNYDSFTDIEFNYKKSINCQAFSAALYVSLVKNNINFDFMNEIEEFTEKTKSVYENNRSMQFNLL